MNSFKVKSWIVLVFSFFYSFTTLGQTSVPAVSAPVAVRDLASATSSAGNSKNSNGNSQNIWAVPLNDKVIIHAAGSVVIHYKEKSNTVKILQSEADTLVQLKEGHLFIEEKEFANNSLVKSNLDLKTFENSKGGTNPGAAKTESSAKKKTLEIEIPALAVDMVVLDGSIELNQLKKDVRINLQKGKMTAKNLQAALNIHGIKTDINIEGGNFNLHTDLYQSIMKIKDFKGNIDLDLFNAELVVEKSNLNGNLRATQGVVKLNQCEGSVQFDFGRAQLVTNQWVGRLEGVSQEGPLTLGLGKEFEIILRTNLAKVNLTPPIESGALVNLTTQEGDIYAPQQYKVVRDNGVKILKARLKGDSSGKNLITVRSQEGSFYLNTK